MLSFFTRHLPAVTNPITLDLLVNLSFCPAAGKLVQAIDANAATIVSLGFMSFLRVLGKLNKKDPDVCRVSGGVRSWESR